ncbi:neurotrimin isoform 1-T8 [Glossina fuscipes fuscipes]
MLGKKSHNNCNKQRNVCTNAYGWILVTCLILGYISCTDGAPENEDNDYYDYDYGEVDNENPDPLITNVKDPPYFEKTQTKVLASANHDVIMDCDVKNMNANNAVVWYKDNTIYTNGQYAINHRVEGLRNNSLLLKNIQTDDAGNYYCEVLPQKIRLHVILEIERTLTIHCDGREVLDRTVVYKQSESHICKCKSPGSDINNIKWFINGQPAEEIVNEIDRNTLILNNIDAHYSGVFQCLDDDGSEKPKHGMFNILVNYIPKVTTHRHHINTNIGSNAELYCDYKSEPIAVTRWLKNGHSLSYSEKYMISYAKDKHFNRTTLIVNDVAEDDLGEYVCQAENALGTSELKTHLMLEPEKGQFEDIKILGNKVILNWIVRSLLPLSEAVLDYKLKGSYTWSTTTVLHTQRHDSGIWKISHEMELTPGEWQTRIKTRNTAGWSKFSMPYIFVIEGGEDFDILPDGWSDRVNDVMLAGFGGSPNNTTSSSPSTKAVSCLSFCSILLHLSHRFH